MVAPKNPFKVVKQFKGAGGAVYRLLVKIVVDGNNEESREFVIEQLMQDTLGAPAWFVVAGNSLLAVIGGNADARWAMCNAIYESTLPTEVNP